ncbi:membrane protein [Dictyobacter sp. S3.2.2.5]|uniref:Membrane protein n=1 Tax=Dictyobacter halimunensis TaxID=3026934 RepID=A0ABQ6G3T5_9CHLR|nr:membrane protein [Dictyobacter sp. S3.2.2.5]
MNAAVLKRWAISALIAAGCLWGMSFLFGKLAFHELSVSQVVLYRFALASLVLLPVAFWRCIWPRPRDLPLFMLTGFLTVTMTFLVQFLGLKLTSASNAALIIGLLPPLLALAAVILTHERLSKGGWLAIGCSSLGAILIVGQPGRDNNWLGDGLVFVSLFAVVGWTLLGKRLSQAYTAIVATAYSFLFGILTLLPISLWWDGVPRLDLSPQAWLSVLILGVLCSASTTVLWNWGLTRFPVARAGVYLNLEPLVGLVLGISVLREPFGPMAVVGGGLILGAAVYLSRQGVGV